MRTSIFAAITVVISMVSCSQPTESNPVPTDDLYGIWVKAGNLEDATILRRAAKLDQGNYGFIIKRNGEFVERKNVGWCGTPPIVYGNFDGEWQSQVEDFLDIEVAFWGGITTFQLEIVSLTATELTVRYLYEY